METDYEKVPGTWAYELREHFNAFSEGCWKSFNAACEAMRDKGHENKVDRLKWREFVLWDMQEKHDQEVDSKFEKEHLDMKWKKIDVLDPATFPKQFEDILFTDGTNVYSGWRKSDDEESIFFVSATLPKTPPETITHWMPLPEPPTS